MKKNIRKALALSLTALIFIFNLPAKTFGWGTEGHQIVATMAEKLLTTQARNKINGLLNAAPHAGETMVSVALWADTIRGIEPGKRPETPNWHFVDIPLGEDDYDASRDCPETTNGSCAVSALVMFQDILAQKKKSYFERNAPLPRYEASKFIIHFVGDLHQPLHCITDTRTDPEGDRGGGTKKVKWFNATGKNLHGIWDTDILRRNMQGQSTAQYANSLFNSLTAAEKNMAKPSNSTTPTVISRGTIEDWAEACHEIGESAYSDLGTAGQGGVFNLGQNYYDAHRSQVDAQLKLAAIRLARILNENLR